MGWASSFRPFPEAPGSPSAQAERQVGHGAPRSHELQALDAAAYGLLNGDLALLVTRKRPDGHAAPVFVNSAFTRLTGFSIEDVGGMRCDFLRGPDTRPEAIAALDQALATDRFCDIDILHYRRDGTPFWNGVTVSPGGEAGVAMILMRDVTARRRRDDRMAELADRLRELAMSDPLTGVGNRRSFDAVLQRAWRRAARDGGCTTLAMIDIDHFKSFNDQFGHPAGDACLRAVAARLAGAIRAQTDFLARYGGEEFAVLLPDLDAAGAEEMGQRLLLAVRDAAISHPCQPAGYISISCGLVTVAPSRYAGGIEQFVQQADQALYQSKAAGRDRVHHVVVD